MLILRSRVFVSCWKLLSQKRCLPQYLSLLLSITHKRQAASDNYLKHRVFFFLSNLSMRDRQKQSTTIGTKPQRVGVGRRCLAAKSILYWNPGTCFLCYCTACPNGDSAHSATGSRPQEFPKNTRILTWGTYGYSQYKRSSWSRSVTMFIWAYTSYELQETNLMTAAPLIIATLLWDLNTDEKH